MTSMRSIIDLFEAPVLDLPMDFKSRMERAQAMGFTTKAYHGTGASFKVFDFDRGQPNPLNGHAPYFSSVRGEAKGYADERKETTGKGILMNLLLRVQKPFVVNYFAPHKMADAPQATPKLFRSLVGKDHDGRRKVQNYDTLQALEQSVTSENPAWGYDTIETRRAGWNEIYRRLREHGFDAIVWPHTLPDFQDHHYDKYIMIDQSGIRSTRARFDPEKSSSTNIMD